MRIWAGDKIVQQLKVVQTQAAKLVSAEYYTLVCNFLQGDELRPGSKIPGKDRGKVELSRYLPLVLLLWYTLSVFIISDLAGSVSLYSAPSCFSLHFSSPSACGFSDRKSVCLIEHLYLTSRRRSCIIATV